MKITLPSRADLIVIPLDEDAARESEAVLTLGRGALRLSGTTLTRVSDGVSVQLTSAVLRNVLLRGAKRLADGSWLIPAWDASKEKR